MTNARATANASKQKEDEKIWGGAQKRKEDLRASKVERNRRIGARERKARKAALKEYHERQRAAGGVQRWPDKKRNVRRREERKAKKEMEEARRGGERGGEQKGTEEGEVEERMEGEEKEKGVDAQGNPWTFDVAWRNT